MSKRILSMDFAITVGFLIIAVTVLVQARGWPTRAALFPLLTGSALLIFVLLKLTFDIVAAARHKAAAPHHALNEDEAEMEAEPDVLATATAAQWRSAIAWIGGFFIALWLLGALIAIPLFALVYLLVASRESVLLSGIYAVVCWAFVYGLFDRIVNVPLPPGVLWTAFR